MPEDSLKKRYVYKLVTNLVGLVINMITQAIIPRALGPKAYGDFNYLTNFFIEIANSLDMGTSICFYTKLSQRQKDSGLVSFYLSFVGIGVLLMLGFVFMATSFPLHSALWPEQEIRYIYMAMIFGSLVWLVQVVTKMSDAYGITVSTEITRMVQRGIGLVLIILLYVSHQLNLMSFFLYQYLILIILIVAFIWIIGVSGYSITKGWILSIVKIKEYVKEFYHYSHPLFAYSLVGLAVGLLDRWILQYFSGSIQQGFFGLSYQIGAVCFLFAGTMTSLLTREFSIVFGKNDRTQMSVLFRRYIPVLYSIVAFFSCFIAFQADRIIYIFGGNKYKEALMAVTIMAFYPIHQTYGQLSGSVFYATAQTRLYRNIGIISMVIGLPLTYFLIAPADKMGLNAGATGLAIKMVLLQFITVNIQLYYNTKYLTLPFQKYFGHQILSIIFLLLIAGISSFGVDWLLGSYNNIMFKFILAGFFYTIIVMGIVWYIPVIFGLRTQDLKALFGILRRACR